MKILVTNDDGIHAPGLWALAREMLSLGRVIVVAPDREQSGMGASVSFHHPVRIVKVRPHIEDVETYSVEGTPADACILGLKVVCDCRPDLVASGVNEGRNLGDDVFISGTVGAAMQAHFLGVPSLAVSVSVDNPHFETAARLATIFGRHIKEGRLPERILLNINLPNAPLEKIAGIAVTKLADQVFNFTIKPGNDSRKNTYWIERGRPQWKQTEGTDRWATDHKLISVTALITYSNSPVISTLKTLAPVIFKELKERT
ncbi:MAG: 5'/3'-nucleotidase SurE [Dehalococcoidia bacterium]|nr:5'/3'-nucleotidase SurE [Dehalococcoidia bacterium]